MPEYRIHGVDDTPRVELHGMPVDVTRERVLLDREGRDRGIDAIRGLVLEATSGGTVEERMDTTRRLLGILGDNEVCINTMLAGLAVCLEQYCCIAGALGIAMGGSPGEYRDRTRELFALHDALADGFGEMSGHMCSVLSDMSEGGGE